MLIIHIILGITSLLISANCLIVANRGNKAPLKKILTANLAFIATIATGLVGGSHSAASKSHALVMVLIFTGIHFALWFVYRMKIKIIDS